MPTKSSLSHLNIMNDQIGELATKDGYQLYFISNAA